MFVLSQDYTPAPNGVEPYIIPLTKPGKGRFVGITVIKNGIRNALAFEIYGFPLGMLATLSSLMLSKSNSLILVHVNGKDNSTQFKMG